jgi:hypothetical protein
MSIDRPSYFADRAEEEMPDNQSAGYAEWVDRENLYLERIGAIRVIGKILRNNGLVWFKFKDGRKVRGRYSHTWAGGYYAVVIVPLPVPKKPGDKSPPRIGEYAFDIRYSTLIDWQLEEDRTLAAIRP